MSVFFFVSSSLGGSVSGGQWMLFWYSSQPGPAAQADIWRVQNERQLQGGRKCLALSLLKLLPTFQTDWNIESIRWRVSICWVTETPACSPADQADIQMTRWVCLTYLAFYSLNAAGMNVENVVGKLFIILRSCIISITTSQVNWVSYKDRNLTFTDHVGGGAMTGWRWDNIVKTVAALCSTALLLNKNNRANHHILSLSLSLSILSPSRQ